MNAELRAPAAPRVKPLLRGVSHLAAWVLSLGALALLVRLPVQGSLRGAACIYGVSLSVMFGSSALYHRPMWSADARARLRKVDHTGIFFLIAGTFTPLAVLEGGALSTVLLWVMWGGAGAGMVFALGWSHAPRTLRAGLYVVLGAVAAPLFLALPQLIGWSAVFELFGGAFIYLLGAVVYARRWPNPRPAIFGYHEVFHLMVIAAAALQFWVVWSQLNAAGSRSRAGTSIHAQRQ